MRVRGGLEYSCNEAGLDEVVVTLHSIPSTSIAVERRTVAIGRCSGLNATAVVPFAIQVSSTSRHGASTAGHGAASRSVECNLVYPLVVDTLDLRSNIASATASRIERATPTISTSPALGQLGPVSQNAGHVPHPCGIWRASRLYDAQ